MSTYIDIETIHTLPFANANRDDAGLPKTVNYGGTQRGRLSSQAIKRAARFYGADKEDGFSESAAAGGYWRTKRTLDLLLQELENRSLNPEDYEKTIKLLFGKHSAFGQINEGKGTDNSLRQDVLTVVTETEIATLVDAVLGENPPTTEKEGASLVKQVLISSGKKDLALWGRFFASENAATLDGSAQVAHAFTTHEVKLEHDFFVGLDDASSLFSDNAGAGHPDSAFYLTGTFYKYANFNLEETVINLKNIDITKNGLKADENLNWDEIKKEITEVVRTFIKNFSLSVPQGKIRSTAHTTPPSFIRVSVRSQRPVNGAIAFETPVRGENITAKSIDKLAKTHKTIQKIYPQDTYSAFISIEEIKGIHREAFGDEANSLDEIINRIVAVIQHRIEKLLTKVEYPRD